MRYSQYIVVVLAMVILAGSIVAQTQPTAAANAQSTPTSGTSVTQDPKEFAQELLLLQEDEVQKSSASVEQLRQLYSEGLIARIELEKAEQDLANANSKVEETRNQITTSDQLMAEIEKAKELAKIKPALVRPTLMGTNLRTTTILRSSSVAGWSIANLGSIQQFFSSKFGHALPTTAMGQSATHDRLGYDHRNAVDVGLHPDSVEGRALISYLQSAGIPFLAFRSAIPGVATGPHIHIGSPSHKLV
jgi:hypothetical protein